MAVLHHTPAESGAVQRVCLATPVYDRPSAGYAHSIFASSAAFSQAGIAVELAILSGDCHVDDARNRLVRDFLLGDCTDLVFLDADMSWRARDLVKLCQYDRDVVAATYPLKQDDDAFPVRYLGKELWSDKDGLLEVDGVPTGFLRIRRHVLQRLSDEAVKFKPKADQRGDLPLIFERQVHNGYRRGGDYAFCHKWRQTGGKIYIDPEICLDHSGEQTWSGSLGHHLRVGNEGALAAGIAEISAGIETPKTFVDMVAAWGNTWAANAAMLNTAVLLARRSTGPVLECGSGLSTLCMAAANPAITIYALEHSQEWFDRITGTAESLGLRNIRMRYAPLHDGWYARDQVPDERFTLAVCDGPPRQLSDRSGIFDCAGIDGAVLVMDDAEGDYIKHLAEWTARRGGHVQVVGRARKFAVSTPGKVANGN